MAAADMTSGSASQNGMHTELRDIESMARDHAAMMRIVNLQTVLIFLMSAGLLFFILKGKPENNFYAMSFEGYVRPLAPFNEPYIDQRAIIDWSAKVAGQIMTFGFNDFDIKMAGLYPYFTEVGWGSFVAAIRKSGLLQAISENQLLLTSVVSGVPEVTFEGVRDGQYLWDVTLKITVTARAGAKTRSLSQEVTMTIVQVSPRKNVSGMGIEGIVIW